MEMFTQKEILLMILVVSVLLVFIIILTILDIREYKKNKNNSLIEDEKIKKEEIKEEIRETVEVLEIPNEQEIQENVVTTDSNELFPDELMIQDDNEVSEVKPIVSYEEEPIKKEDIAVNVNLDEEIKKIEKTMVNTDTNLEDTITSFEQEQERTAIISLDELLKKSDELYSDNEITQYDDGNEPISIDEVMDLANRNSGIYDDASVPEVMADIVEEKKLYSKKESIPFISSVYGIETNNQLEFENTASYEKLSRVQNKEFMNKLREMKENK